MKPILFRLMILGMAWLVACAAPTLSGCTPSQQPITPTPDLVGTQTLAPLTVTPGVLTVATDQDWPPYQYLDASRQPSGFDVDLSRAIADQLGLEIQFLPDTWAGAQFKVRQDQADCIFSFTPSEDRAKFFDFSEVYLTATVAVVVKNSSDYQKVEDLYGKRIAVEGGSIGWVQPFLGKHYPNLRILKTDSLEESLSALQTDRVEGVVIGAEEAGNYVAARIGLDIRPVLEGTGSENSVGVRKGNQVLADEISRALTDLKTDGTYTRLYQQWFGAP